VQISALMKRKKSASRPQRRIAASSGSTITATNRSIQALGNYSKGLKHDARAMSTRLVRQHALRLQSGAPADFEAIVLGGDVPLVDPQCGLAFSLIGGDPQSFALEPAPKLASAQRAGEAVEDYWMALLRDVPSANTVPTRWRSPPSPI